MNAEQRPSVTDDGAEWVIYGQGQAHCKHPAHGRYGADAPCRDHQPAWFAKAAHRESLPAVENVVEREGP